MSFSSESAQTEGLNMIPEPLNALTFPLFGKRLIEASAGTGKTYTIANLYLRLLVPTGQAGDLDKPLTVDQILVVTFTEAATAELKARIRGRIRAARKALLQGESSDVFLADWLVQMSDEQRAGAIEKLLYAEKQMDEAAVFTIHGFCQRMLSQNAFESRMLFQQTIETDELAPLFMAVKDVWRSVFYPMDDTKAALIQPIWSNPDALLKDLY
jgi:exodeoxyribonuclease V beta subunit